MENKIDHQLIKLDIHNVRNNELLKLGVSKTQVEDYERITQNFGNVSPIVVRKSENIFELLQGQAVLEASEKTGQSEIFALQADVDGEIEGLELAITLESVNQQNSSITEGLLIQKLLDNNVSRERIMKLTGKSKAWISKRLKLSNSLHQEVQKMVSQREISIRMAEEIANLPLDVQVPFSVKVSANKFDDENVKLLVKKYLRNDTTELEREQIINNPSLLKLEKKITKNTRKGRGNEPPKPSPLKPSPQKPGTSQTSEKQKGKGKDDDKDNSKNNDLVNHLNYAQKVLKKLNELVVNVNHQEFIDNIDLVNKFINLCKDFEVRVKLKQK